MHGAEKRCGAAIDEQLAAAGQRHHDELASVALLQAVRTGFERAHPDLEMAHTQAAVGGGEALFAVTALQFQMGVADDLHGGVWGDECFGPVCAAHGTGASPERAIAAWPAAHGAPPRRGLRQNVAMQVQDAAPTFALAKIQPPRPRSALIERQALEHSLGQALQQHKLTCCSHRPATARQRR